MASDNVSSQKSLGFVSVRQRLDQGYFGGYLLINSVARPLEFHCTVPVQPTRAQSILFGPTLEEFLCGEQICRALLSRAKLQPQVVLVDAPAALCVRHWIDLPILWVRARGGTLGGALGGISSEQSSSGELLSPTNLEHGFQTPSHQRNASEYAERSSEHYRFCCLDSYRSDLDAIDWLNESYAIEHDLREPFERIIEALSEAHPRTKAA
jgi:endogenous inhibitor of DNA gyrase (YacG/DUF329 family)